MPLLLRRALFAFALILHGASSLFTPRPCAKALCKRALQKKILKKKILKRTCKRQRSGFFSPPPLPPILAAPLLGPPAAFLAVMGAPVYGKDLGPNGFGGGLLSFDTLEPRTTPNEYLAAPPGDCAAFQPKAERDGGGGGPRRGLAPAFSELPVQKLQETFLKVVEDQYTIKAYARPTLSRAEERRFVFVQRTPLLRFPDVINVQFIELPGAGSTLTVHSASVFGVDDLGKNRERVTAWLAALEDAVAALPVSSPGEPTAAAPAASAPAAAPTEAAPSEAATTTPEAGGGAGGDPSGAEKGEATDTAEGGDDGASASSEAAPSEAATTAPEAGGGAGGDSSGAEKGEATNTAEGGDEGASAFADNVIGGEAPDS